jgi:hypothetical protein
VHLLDLADELGAFELLGHEEDRHELVERQTRSEVVRIAAVSVHSQVALQMALFADRIAKRGRQAAGVDDCRVEAVSLEAGLANVQGAGAVASLATDRFEVERRLVTIDGPPGRMRAIDVA